MKLFKSKKKTGSSSSRRKRSSSGGKEGTSSSMGTSSSFSFSPAKLKRSSSSSLLSSPSQVSGGRIRKNSSLMSSLGTGSLGHDGSVSFIRSPITCNMRNISDSDSNINTCRSSLFPSSSSTMGNENSSTKVLRRSCSFLRVADLEMDDESVATTSMTSDEDLQQQQQQQQPSTPQHTHRPSKDPPPGIEIDPKERWIALCTTPTKNDRGNDHDAADEIGTGGPEHTPIAPVAMEKLANFGATSALDESMWQPDGKTDKLMKKAGSSSTCAWMNRTFQTGKIPSSICSVPSSKDVLIWSGTFKHGLYGSDVPAIRSVGIFDTSARKLMELLVDSSRVKEYNKISLGRKDVIMFDGDLEKGGPFGRSITKVMRSESKPPMLKPLALTSILHAKELPGTGYLIVSRGVHRPGAEEEVVSSGATKSDIVIGVNLIVDFENDNNNNDDRNRDNNNDNLDRCLMINVNHLYSAMVPLYIAKKVAVSAAHGFINDLRSCV